MTNTFQADSEFSILNSQLKIAVLAGGIGQEREVSLQSGQCVTEALKEAGLNVVMSDIRPDDLHILDDSEVDVYFVALHGKFGEDGQLQQVFEDKGLTYTGSGPKASELAFDKTASKKLFAEAGVSIARSTEFDANTVIDEIKEQLEQLGDKLVVKPIRQGSSVGISIVNGVENALSHAKRCLAQFGDCMIEEFIAGREITVGILCGKTLPIIEIRAKANFYDYQAKYIDDYTEYLFDTIQDNMLIKKIESAALECFNVLGCRHFARVDFILGDDNKVYALEVNTIPGFTTHSLVPKAAVKAGMSTSQLYVKMIEAAVKNKLKVK
ncbi:MAG: D-alanine--D-alanine ligase [Planctomycetota bacterium]|jgi:D-alanine-D-alanine ligase